MSMIAPTTSDTLSLKDLLRVSYESKASDLHINASTEPLMRLHGKLMKVVDLCFRLRIHIVWRKKY